MHDKRLGVFAFKGVSSYLTYHRTIQMMAATTGYIHGEVVMARAELGVCVCTGTVDVGCAVTATVVAGPVVVDVTVIIARAFKGSSTTCAPTQVATR